MTDTDAAEAAVVYPGDGVSSDDRAFTFASYDASPWHVASEWTGAPK